MSAPGASGPAGGLIPSAGAACALIACLDGAATIGDVVRRTLAYVPDVLVVDDGSTDQSARLAAEAGAIVIRHDVNQGKGAALMTGLAAARTRGYTHAVALDADGQHDPADIPALLAASRSSPRAIIIGVRDFDVPNVPGSSRFGRKFSNFWVRLETGRPLDDTQSGFRAYPVELTLALPLAPSRFQWEIEVLVRAAWAGLETLEVPVHVHYPPPDERTSHYRGFVDSVRISVMHTRLVLRWLLRPIWPTRRLPPAP